MSDNYETYSIDTEDVNSSDFENIQELPEINDIQDIDVSWESIDFGGDDQPDGLF